MGPSMGLHEYPTVERTESWQFGKMIVFGISAQVEGLIVLYETQCDGLENIRPGG